MKFLKATQYAAIGHRIRRDGWSREQASLSMDQFGSLWWTDGIGCMERPIRFDSVDSQFDLDYSDLNADDWDMIPCSTH